MSDQEKPKQRGSLGGRGKVAAEKYRPVTVTLHPDVLAVLDDSAARREVSRSEMVTEMIGLWARMRAPKKPK